MPRITLEVLKNLFKKPATVKYPFEHRDYPERLRGKTVLVRERCVSCGLCARVCPSWAITYDDEKKPIFDVGRCIFCGECADVCPTTAIIMSREFELATFDKETLISKQ